MIIRHNNLKCRMDLSHIRIRYYDKNNIGISHCWYNELKSEFVGIMPITNFLNMDQNDFVSYLNESYKKMADTHDYTIKHYCETNKSKCIFGTESIKSIGVMLFSHCNIDRCPMCLTSDNKTLTFDEDKNNYFNILNKLKNMNLDYLMLTTIGEPFLCKTETFNYLSSLTLNDTKEVRIISNLTLLNEDDIIKLYNIQKETGISLKITASCSAITPETYFKVHANNNFNKVINNILLLKKYNLLWFINFVVQNLNLHELSLYKEFLNSNNITDDKINITPDITNKNIVKTKEYIDYITKK